MTSPPASSPATSRATSADDDDDTRFAGFDEGCVALLAELPGYDTDRYATEKARLTDGLVRPGFDLVADLVERVSGVAADATTADAPVPPLTVTRRGSVSPLHRDLRFAPAGSPRYKDHLLLTAWAGSDKRTAPTLWLRVDAEAVGFASGIGFTPAARQRWRSAVGGDAGVGLAEALDRLCAERDAEIAGDQVKRVPAPFSGDHPRADLLRRTGFQVRFIEPLPAVVGEPAFVDWCLDRWTALLPVHHWLVGHVADEAGTAPR